MTGEADSRTVVYAGLSRTGLEVISGERGLKRAATDFGRQRDLCAMVERDQEMELTQDLLRKPTDLLQCKRVKYHN